MKLHLKYLWIVLVACTLTACMNGGVTWPVSGSCVSINMPTVHQRRWTVYSIIFKRKFFCHMFVERWRVDYVFGNYSLKGAEISIILLPESVNDKNYDTYFGWPEGKCTFKVEDLSYSSLRLEYEGTKSIFRKF